MYDMHKELNEFYEDHVRLKDERTKLTENRDVNLAALKDGLKKLKYLFGFDKKNQGSFAMNTINKHPDKKYDIDVAIIFEKDDLPSNPKDARERIEAAMIEGGGNFKVPPEAKTNAVRVSYAEGHHVDLAVYRKNKDALGNPIIEHAGSEWTARNPVDITKWFTDEVQSKSPTTENGSVVGDMQLRRIVRWLKMFSKSRSSWNLPGGLTISALAVESYIPNQYRDDSSLYDTMSALKNRLMINKEVKNPVDSAQMLTCREKDITRVKNFAEKIDLALEELKVLFEYDCTRPKALKAWQWVFNHVYWSELLEELNSAPVSKKDGPVVIKTVPAPWMKGR